MTKEKMISKLEEIMDVDKGSLTPTTILEELEEWDSLSALTLMSFSDEELGKALSDEDLKSFKTIQDILDRLM